MRTIKVIKICILFHLFLVYGCTNNKNSNKERDSNIEIGITNNDNLSFMDSLLTIHKNNEYFSCKRNIKNGVYDLEIETIYKNDTLADDIPLKFVFPVIVNQELTFKKNDTIIKKVDLPFKRIIRLNKSGKKIEMLEMSIWLIYSMKGVNESVLFGIDGTGLCLVGDCPEYVALFSGNGDMLSLCHYLGENKWESPCIEKDILEKYGITNSTHLSARNKGTLVDIWK
jgi:hypothetical protein